MIAGGFVLAATGFVLISLVDTDSLWLILTGAGVLASGIVTVLSLVSDMALASAPAEKAGSAASLLETGTEFGGALGMAVLGSLGTAVYRHDLAGSEPAVRRPWAGPSPPPTTSAGRPGSRCWPWPGRPSSTECSTRPGAVRRCCSGRPCSPRL